MNDPNASNRYAIELQGLRIDAIAFNCALDKNETDTVYLDGVTLIFPGEPTITILDGLT